MKNFSSEIICAPYLLNLLVDFHQNHVEIPVGQGKKLAIF